jgi:hypothetical protein
MPINELHDLFETLQGFTKGAIQFVRDEGPSETVASEPTGIEVRLGSEAEIPHCYETLILWLRRNYRHKLVLLFHPATTRLELWDDGGTKPTPMMIVEHRGLKTADFRDFSSRLVSFDNPFIVFVKQRAIDIIGGVKQLRAGGDAVVIGNNAPVNISDSVINSFNTLSQSNPELVSAIKTLGLYVEDSHNKEAAEYFDELVDRIAAGESNKTLIKALWHGITTALPGANQLTDVAAHVLGGNEDVIPAPRSLASTTSDAPRIYTVWYATNRAVINENYSSDPSEDGSIAYGVCKVAIPKSHVIGSLGSILNCCGKIAFNCRMNCKRWDAERRRS